MSGLGDVGKGSEMIVGEELARGLNVVVGFHDQDGEVLVIGVAFFEDFELLNIADGKRALF